MFLATKSGMFQTTKSGSADDHTHTLYARARLLANHHSRSGSVRNRTLKHCPSCIHIVYN